MFSNQNEIKNEPKDPCLKSPHFNMQPFGAGPDILTEYLLGLEKINDNLIKNYDSLNGEFKCESVSIFVFSISEKLNLNTEGKFLALELFDRFMTVHVNEIKSAVNKAKNKNWQPTFDKIKKQMILRSLSCIQLANKLCSNNTVITCSQIKQLLAGIGYEFSTDSILNSEMRVFKYLDYRLNLQTPYTFMETLLEVLGNNNEQLDPKIFYGIGVKILERFYYSRTEIFDRLYECMTGRTKDKNENPKDLAIIENDYLFLSSSIIVASSQIYNKNDKNFQKKVLEEISLISKISKDDLDDFSTVLCYFVIFE